MQRSPAASTRSLVFFGSCENKLCHYKRSRELRCITPGIVQCRVCENAALQAIKQLRKITFHKAKEEQPDGCFWYAFVIELLSIKIHKK